jgi:hypothetical protein
MPDAEDFRARRRGKYGTVLFATLFTILATVVLPEEGWERIALTVLQGGMLWLAFVASGVSRSLIRSSLVIWALAAVATSVAELTAWEGSGALTSLINLVLIAAAGGAILRNLVIGGRITTASVGGVLTVYLLIGLFFTYVYATIDAISDTPALDGPGPIDLSEEIYFAFITLTTVGYGDFTPATDLVRGLAITQALVGQLYLVSVVALVVSNLGREAPGRRADDPE